MKAVGYQTPGALDRPEALIDIDLPMPAPGPQDLLVRVAAVSVNPVDTKVRKRATPAPGQWQVLGYDAVGTVTATGAAVQGFAPGDRVFYAGDITRPGANSEFHLVDARIAARAPQRLSDAEAAALPLTAITAWEMLFDRLEIARPVPGAARAVVIIGAAGGVGSVAVQLARALSDVTVIATASRPETADWVRDLGAHHVLDHSQPLAPQVAALGLGAPGHVFSITQTHQHLADVVEFIAPQGRFGLIDDPDQLDILPFKRKSVSVHWESMFTRSTFRTPDMGEQGRLLAEVAGLIDSGRLRSTLAERMAPLNAATLRAAHERIESGRTRGKIVIEGF
ncbi:zinc-binding alcohol dehydrogenase family protein [Gemmobacter caeruleus]|uniref:zinc-binding alcohol dehydrogenase family protein n=1 Tax=Gemmobacter caeruleus TaxID=2595004 RepID=UPI0011EC8A7C|nr:zinc-binding alcohol dehydrogenase family protein [Gemmobacter caeruleus]